MLKTKIFAIIVSLLCLSACTNYSATTYSGSDVRNTQTVEYGTVDAVHSVRLEEKRDAVIGTTAGGVIGGVVGSVFGSGKGRTLATLGGAALGALTGYGSEKAITKQDGLEIQITLESGQIISVVQAADEMFVAGDRVRVLRSSDGSSRVTRP